MAPTTSKREVKKLVKKDVDKVLKQKVQRAAKPARPRQTGAPANTNATRGGATGVSFPSGPGMAGLATTTSADIAKEQWAHAMSLLNPGDPTYNKAPCAQAVGQPTVVYNTVEKFVAGCPTQNPTAGSIVQASMGMGGVVCRPNTLFNQFAFTEGSDYMGYVPGSNGQNAPCLCVNAPTEGDYAGQSFFTLNFDGELGPYTIYDKGTDVPDWFANARGQEIQGLSELFRCSSAMLTATYIGPPIIGSGLITAATIPRDYLVGFAGTADQIGGVFDAAGFSYDSLVNLYNSYTGPAKNGAHVKYIPYDDHAFEMKPTVFQYTSFFETPDNLTREQRLKASCLNPKFGSNAIKRFMKNPVTKDGALKPIEWNRDPQHRDRITFSFEEQGSVDAAIDFISSLKFLLANKQVLTPKEDPSDDVKQAYHTLIKSLRHLEIGNAPGAVYPSLDYFGSSTEGAQPQPCDVNPDSLEQASALAAAWVSLGYTAMNAALDTFLQYKSNIDYSYSEPMLCIAWQGVTVDVLQAPAGYSGQMFEIIKYVNYETLPSQNTLVAASTGNAQAAVFSPSASTAIQMATLVPPTGAGVPKSSDWGTKLKDALKKGMDFSGKVVGGLGKAADVAAEIGSILAMFA